ncbi:unnamed protein product [Echinostoma caproni]|uniref:Homeobox domain-containing protein n=1 Tax=Echinostoma caproni TaxID=27848 RepID=A0A183ARP6_9TREM|nr:unnamed protein product [Echinostoma caproni]
MHNQRTGYASIPIFSRDSNGGKQCRRRKARTVFSDHQLLGLEHRFETQHYLSTPERIELANQLSLSETQVKTWFQNRRMKHKKMKRAFNNSGFTGTSSGSKDGLVICADEDEEEDTTKRTGSTPSDKDVDPAEDISNPDESVVIGQGVDEQDGFSDRQTPLPDDSIHGNESHFGPVDSWPNGSGLMRCSFPTPGRSEIKQQLQQQPVHPDGESVPTKGHRVNKSVLSHLISFTHKHRKVDRALAQTASAFRDLDSNLSSIHSSTVSHAGAGEVDLREVSWLQSFGAPRQTTELNHTEQTPNLQQPPPPVPPYWFCSMGSWNTNTTLNKSST